MWNFNVYFSFCCTLLFWAIKCVHVPGCLQLSKFVIQVPIGILIFLLQRQNCLATPERATLAYNFTFFFLGGGGVNWWRIRINSFHSSRLCCALLVAVVGVCVPFSLDVMGRMWNFNVYFSFCCTLLDAVLAVCVPFSFGVLGRMWNSSVIISATALLYWCRPWGLCSFLIWCLVQDVERKCISPHLLCFSCCRHWGLCSFLIDVLCWMWNLNVLVPLLLCLTCCRLWSLCSFLIWRLVQDVVLKCISSASIVLYLLPSLGFVFLSHLMPCAECGTLV